MNIAREQTRTVADLEDIALGIQTGKFPEVKQLSALTLLRYGELIRRVIIAGVPVQRIFHNLIESTRREIKLRQEVSVAKAGAVAGGLVIIGLVPASFLVALGFGLSLEIFSTMLGLLLALIGVLLIVGSLIIFLKTIGRIFSGIEQVSEYALIAVLLEVGMDSKSAIELAQGIDARIDRDSRSASYLKIMREGAAHQMPIANKFRQFGEDIEIAQEAMLRKRIETLGTKLLLPLGGMLLPAFVVLVVIPLLLGVVSASF